MEKKYKINELAKLFNMTSKELLEIIKDKTTSDKRYSTTTSISGDDLEIALELITRQASVSSFAEYEASARPLRPQAKSMADIEAGGEQAVKAEEKPAPAPAPAEKKPEKKPAKPQEKPVEKAEKAEKPDKAEKPAKQAKPAKSEQPERKPAKPQEKPEKRDKQDKQEVVKTEAPAAKQPAQTAAPAQAPAAAPASAPAATPVASAAAAATAAPAAAQPTAAKQPTQPLQGAKIFGTISLDSLKKSGDKQKKNDRQNGQQKQGKQDSRRSEQRKQDDGRKSEQRRQDDTKKPEQKKQEAVYKSPLANRPEKTAEELEAIREAKELRKKKEQSKQNRPKEKRPDAVILRPQGQSDEAVGAVVVQQAEIEPADNGVKRRLVDTRANNVDIERYNQKYDDLAHAKGGRASEQGSSKQKLTQKSQQYNKKGKPAGKQHRETEAERLKRIALERKLKPVEITIPDEITVGELATRLKMTSAEVIKKLMVMGVMAGINDVIDFDTAYLAATELGAKVEREVVVTIEERIIDDSEDTDDNLIPRSPVVVVMGHVDHGKTSLLDYIRHAHVTAGEAGGITQHIGAYRVTIGDREITFLDTPGHEAFTTMRARGAQVTDIAVLVVAADDGIMPQTVEAINHAKAAGVSIIVAINKMDKESANPDSVMQQLTEYELVPEAWGGDVICVPVSAKTGMGIDDLLENIVLVADMKELKANPDRAAKGTVIEARLDKGRGPVATVLVQNGTLHNHDIVVAGTAVGRIRAMTNDCGAEVETAGPSIPVEIIGLDSVPHGGDIFNAVSDERLARELVEQRRNAQKEEVFQQQTKVTLDNVFAQMQEGDMKELKIIVKADVQGSVEAVRQSLEKLSNEEVRVHIIHGAVGAVNESDVMLADASNAIIVGFNVRPDAAAAENAQRAGVDMRLYRIIYDCIEEIESALKGMLAPKTRVVDLGSAEVRQTIKISNIGTIAGSYVVQGKIERRALIRVVRDGIVIAEDQIKSLRRFKDDVKEVAQGYECGIGLEKYNDIKEGDFLEAFIIEEYRD